MKGFSHVGGMINPHVDDDRIKLEIHPDNAERAAPKIRSKLLRRVDVVRNPAD